MERKNNNIELLIGEKNIYNLNIFHIVKTTQSIASREFEVVKT